MQKFMRNLKILLIILCVLLGSMPNRTVYAQEEEGEGVAEAAQGEDLPQNDDTVVIEADNDDETDETGGTADSTDPAFVSDCSEDTQEDADTVTDTKAREESSTVKASENELTISSDFALNADGTYIMADAEQKHVYVSYTVDSPQDKVLVLSIPEYGVNFYESSLPSANDDISEVKLIDPHTFAIRLRNSNSVVELTNTFTLKSVQLTNDQAAYLIDNGMQETKLSVAEYTYDGSLDSVLSEGTKGIEEVAWTGQPYYDHDATIIATHTYKAETTPISTEQNRLTDAMLSYIGYGSSSNAYMTLSLRSGEPRFQLPVAYSSDGSLMEIVSIRFYVPDDRLLLFKIGATQSGNGFQTRDLKAEDFSEQWSNWTISEEMTDSNGNKYYEITPPSRWFNINTLDLSAFYGGMVLTWQLEDPDDPLDVKTDYVAANTIVTYRIPGSGDLQIDDIRGSELLTYDVRYRTIDRLFNDENRSWNKGSDINHEVIVGSIHRDESFGTVQNNSYLSGQIHYVPEYTSAATQTWEFPYQIQPLKMVLIERCQHSYSSSGRSELASISYTTWEDENTVVQIDETEIALANSRIKQNRGNGYYSNSDNLILSYVFPEGVHVKNIYVNWNELATEYKWLTPWNNTNAETVRTDFDYKVNDWTNSSENQHLEAYSWVQVKYRDTFSTTEGETVNYQPPVVNGYSNSASRKNIQNENYLWFRLVPQVDPYLYGEGLYYDATIGRYYSNIPVYLINDQTLTIGHIGFYVGAYGERRDEVKNPVINLAVSQNKQSYDTYWCSNSNTFNDYTRSYLDGITNDQLISLLTGEFTAMPKLAGWTFEYTTKKHPDGLTYTIAGDIPEDGRVEQIPLEEEDCFTSLKLSYNGYADLSHDSEEDTRTIMFLMKDIKIKRATTNPLTGEAIRVHDEYHMAALTLIGNAAWDDCICSNNQHSAPDGKSQTMIVNKRGQNNNLYAPRVLLYNSREVRFNEKTQLKTTAVQNISQGGSTSADFDLNYRLREIGPRVNEMITGDHDMGAWAPFNGGIPWGEVHEAVYIELTDDEFIPDLANTRFMGYAANSAQVIADTVTTDDGKKFLILRLADGVVIDEKLSQGSNYTNAYTKLLKVAFISLPGTKLGDHHPIGDIYYDASLLLEHYDAPNKTGYDLDRTKYIFSENAIADEYGFAVTDVESAKLFKDSGAAFTVHVDISMQAGVDLAPGKNEVTYDFGDPGDPTVTRTIEFYPTEENDLNALITLKGPGSETSGSIYDMEAYVVIPRIGTDITWTNTETGVQNTQANEELDLYMRNAATILSNGGNLDVTILYTTQPDIDQNEMLGYTYVPALEITDWSQVTGIKVYISEVLPQEAVNIHLDLRCNTKENTDILTAYSGGLYRYKQEESGAFTNQGILQLCVWKYENIVIGNGGSGSVFWDWYDENGLKSSNNSQEPYIKGVNLTLYDSDGTLICSATTDNNGAFKLETYKTDAGQYIIIGDPAVTDGTTVKLTKKSSSSAINSNTDSDFGREDHKLVLGTLSANGLSNISAGFIKLPRIVKPNDVVMNANATFNMNVLVNEYISNTTYNASNVLLNGYTIGFTGYDASLVSLSDTSLAKQSNTQLKAPLTITAADDYGTTTVTITVKNSLGDEVTETFRITINRIVLHTEDYEGTYDGDPHKGKAYVTLNGDDVLEGATFEYRVSENTGNGKRAPLKADGWTTVEPTATDVEDSCTVEVKATHPTYGTVEGSYRITITPASLSISTSTEEKVYDGDPLTGTAEVTGLVKDEIVTITVTGTITDRGSVDNSYTIAFDGTAKQNNYTIDSETIGTLTVTPAPLTINTSTEEKIYDGDPLTGTAEVTGLVKDETVTITATGSQTDAGSSENTYTLVFDGTAKENNYYIASVDTGNLNVTPAPLTITTSTEEKVYDGDPLTGTAEVTGLVKDETVTITATGSQTDAGNSENTYALVFDGTAKENNYYIDSEDIGNLNVTPAPLSISTSSETKEYDGRPLTGSAEISGLVKNESVTLTATGSQTEVGSSDNTYSLVFDGTAKESNYFIDNEEIGTLTVTPRSIPDDPDTPHIIPKTGIEDNRMSCLSLLAGLCALYLIRKNQK